MPTSSYWVDYLAAIDVLHVANGTSTTRTIEAAGIPGICSIWADPLYEGPVPGGLSDAELLEVRTRYLAGSAGLEWHAWAGGDPSSDPANDLRQWRAAIDGGPYDELILWFEHDLFDQLNLIQLLSWIHSESGVTAPVSLICIGSFPGRPDFKGLGELTPAELASLLDIRQRVTDRQFALAERAWKAFREPTPESLDDLRQGDTSALPHLGPALIRFLQEYPWTRDGLSRSERRLLELADDRIALWKVFPRMHEGERFYYVTDASLAAMAEMLSRASPPLLTLDLSHAEEGHSLRGAIVLTAIGRLILGGADDRVEACGIDRWLGGVHLSADSRIWRWDETGQRIV